MLHKGVQTGSTTVNNLAISVQSKDVHILIHSNSTPEFTPGSPRELCVQENMCEHL